MRENIYFNFMHNHISIILSLVMLWFNTTPTTSFGHQLVAAAGGAANTCIDKERQALLDLKAPLHDPKGVLSTWASDEEDDCCQWWGVTCNNQTGHVTKLKLYFGQLEGEISLSFLNLTYLNCLNLSSNSFYGNIPKFIGNMTHLSFLDLGENQFNGSIPKAIGHLTQLTFLELRNNEFTGTIPESIGNMTQLTYLSLWGNNFNGIIPESIGSLTQLTDLVLMGNQFTGTLPESIGNMTQLTSLVLRGNTFSGIIPSSIGFLTQLTSLVLGGNNFSGIIPKSFGSLIHLKDLYLDSLGSCGVENLDWLSSLSKLQRLSMDGISLAKANKWVNVVIGLKNLSDLSLRGCDLSQVMHPYSSSVNSSLSLDHLYLDYNNLNASIYRWMCPLTGKKLKFLTISGNTFDGKLSDFLNSLSGCTSATLKKLDASSSQFTGSLSDAILNFSYLVRLNLSSNELDGTICDELWELPMLEELDLSSNSLKGAISLNIGKSNLLYIDLSHNSLEGVVFNVPSSLFVLDLSKNKLSGGVSFLCQIVDGVLSYFDISANSFTGQIPDCLWHLGDLVVLNLANNNLSGKIPASVKSLVNLEALYLYNNNLSGELPSSLKHCTHLTFLNLGENKFSGNVPVWIGENLSHLYVLSLASNNFYGTIPLQLCHLVNLQILDLSINNLYGTIPSCVNNLTAMVRADTLDIMQIRGNRYTSDHDYFDHVTIQWKGKVREFSKNLESVKSIDLSSNNLTGKIPYEVTNLYQLVALNLSKNALRGEIPRQISQLEHLETLDLSNNNFSGELPSSMSQMHFLNDLNVSHNRLSGRIPSGTQFDTSESSRYIGNAGLCGRPLTNCPGDKEVEGTPVVGERKSDGEDIDELQKWFYIGGSAGFATGFGIVVSALLLHRRGSRAFFHFHDSVKDWVYVQVMVFIAKWRRVARA